MSCTFDPAKLKVVELRLELTKRGLDSKGNKPALVKRLKEALEEELKEEIPNTSIADTSTEDLDTSQNSEELKIPECTNNENVVEVNETADEAPLVEEKMEVEDTKPEEPLPEESADPELEDAQVPEEEKSSEVIPEEKQSDEPVEVEKVVAEEKVEVEKVATEEKVEVEKVIGTAEEKVEENGERVGHDQEEPKSRKSRWGSEVEIIDHNNQDESMQENNQSEQKEPVKIDEEHSESKGEKRKRGSPSPEKFQRRRSRSPIREDEPPIDNDKVQLSWYDSDLHLQLDKESFLSAKPFHEGAFGFAWAGVRATHGVSTGKVCYEVKITEQLKWEDFSKHDNNNRGRREQRRSDSRQKNYSNKDRNKSSSDTATEDKSINDNISQQSENGDVSKKSNSEEVNTEENEKLKTEEEETTEKDKASDEVMEVVKEDEGQPETANIVDDDSEKIEDTATTQQQQEEEEQKQQEQKEEEQKEDEEKKPEDSTMEVDENKELEPLPTHLFRVGWSLLKTGLQLGENKFSYGYESTGKFLTNKEFQDYGVTFDVGDVIGSYVSIDAENVSIIYTVNGEAQPIATTIPKTDFPEDFVLFPHVLSRNYAFELNLGNKEEAWFPKPEHLADYEYLDKIENKIAGPVRPENRSECEVILMCGLPGSGKTHWVREHVESNLDKNYTLLGNTHLLDKMTISGDPLKTKYRGRWTILLDKLQKCLNKLIEIAALRRRNYIIDQTNVFPSAQRRKLRPFEGFKRRAVVIVVGDEEQVKRQSLQEAQGGKDVADSTILEMKANMGLPQKSDWIDEVIYADLDETEAKSTVQKYNTQGREAGYGSQKKFSHRDDRHRWQNRRNDYRRGGNYRDRNYHNNRYNRGPQRQGGNWHSQRPGGWNRDRRDNRGPPMGGGGGGGGGSGGGSRDWRNNRGSGRDRGNRDSHNQVSNYNRNRNQSGRGSSGSWQSSGGCGGWGQGQGTWSNQAWSNQGPWSSAGGGGQSGWGGASQSSQNQWKYGGNGGGHGGYGNYSNWSYYGQYAQNWNTQGQTQATSGGGGGSAVTGTGGTGQYGQYSQQAWAQYAQQYAQQGQNTTPSTTSQSAIQK